MIPADAPFDEEGVCEASYALNDETHAPVDTVTFAKTMNPRYSTRSHSISLDIGDSHTLYRVSTDKDDGTVEECYGNEDFEVISNDPGAATRIVAAMRKLDALGKLVYKA
jgi:hypothetical protein